MANVNVNSRNYKKATFFAMEWKVHMFIFCLLILAVHNQEEITCSLSRDAENITVTVPYKLTKPGAISISFQNSSSGKNEKLLVCDLIDTTKYYCDCGKGSTCGEMSNAFYVVVKNTIKSEEGCFVTTINEKKTILCHLEYKDTPANNTNQQRKKRYIEWKCPLNDPSKDQKTSESGTSPATDQENSTKCKDGVVQSAVTNTNIVERGRFRRSCEPPAPEGNPENFQNENGKDHLAIRLGLGITAIVAVTVIVSAFFVKKYLLQKRSHDRTVSTHNNLKSPDKTEALSPLNPRLPDESGNKEIQEPADQENEKMVVIALHESAGDQSQCVFNYTPLNVVRV